MKVRHLVAGLLGASLLGWAAFAQDTQLPDPGAEAPPALDAEMVEADLKAQGFTDISVLDDDTSDGLLVFEATDPSHDERVNLEIEVATGLVNVEIMDAEAAD